MLPKTHIWQLMLTPYKLLKWLKHTNILVSYKPANSADSHYMPQLKGCATVERCLCQLVCNKKDENIATQNYRKFNSTLR